MEHTTKPNRARSGSAPAAPPRVPRGVLAGALLAAALTAWALHRASIERPRPAPSAQAAATVSPQPPASLRSPPAPVAQTSVRRQQPAPPPAEATTEAQHRAEQVRTMVGMARAQIQRSVRILGDNPEAAANHAWPYFQGWIDAVLAIDPNLADAMSDDFDAVLCDGSTTGAEKLVLLRIATEEPLFATQRGLGCVITSHVAQMKEDVVLWAGLEAWQVAKLPVSPELERLTGASNEQRTLRRLAAIRGESPLAELAQRMAEGPVTAEPAMSDPPPQAQAAGPQL